MLTQLLRGGAAENDARNPALPVEAMRRIAESLGTAARVRG
ncbi:hypothetical protein [Streptomyces sp. NPDC058457]